jgi:uncharacterized protein YcfJ
MMNKKVMGTVIGAMVGAAVLGVCTSQPIWTGVGAVLGAFLGLVVALSQIKMKKDRETGLDG